MAQILVGALLSIAASPSPERGDDPSGPGGVLIIVGIAIVVLALAAFGLWMASKRGGRVS